MFSRGRRHEQASTASPSEPLTGLWLARGAHVVVQARPGLWGRGLDCRRPAEAEWVALAMRCPKCDAEQVQHQGPGPGQGGIYRISCQVCGHEEAGICDPGLPDDEAQPPVAARQAGPGSADTQTRGSEDGATGPCSVCGRPGRVQNPPGGVPASDCFCEEHTPSFTIKPLAVLLLLAAALAVLWLAW